MPDINVGESVELRGRWTVHPEYGKQFWWSRCDGAAGHGGGHGEVPGSGLIKGVGPVTAKRIVRHFGVETLNVIEETPDRLHEVPGVGPKRGYDHPGFWEEQTRHQRSDALPPEPRRHHQFGHQDLKNTTATNAIDIVRTDLLPPGAA
ncbi:MAG: helix-hairpin-helix domain-containing protein [Caldilineaceae bacterium]